MLFVHNVKKMKGAAHKNSYVALTTLKKSVKLANSAAENHKLRLCEKNVLMQ